MFGQTNEKETVTEDNYINKERWIVNSKHVMYSSTGGIMNC